MRSVLDQRGQAHNDEDADHEMVEEIVESRKRPKSRFIRDEANEASDAEEEDRDEEDEDDSADDDESDEEPEVISPPKSVKRKKSVKDTPKKRSKTNAEKPVAEKRKGEKEKGSVIVDTSAAHSQEDGNNITITENEVDESVKNIWETSRFNPSQQPIASTPKKIDPPSGACRNAHENANGQVINTPQRERTNSTNSSSTDAGSAGDNKVIGRHFGSCLPRPDICVYYQPEPQCQYSENDLFIDEDLDQTIDLCSSSSSSSIDRSINTPSPTYSFLNTSSPRPTLSPVSSTPMSDFSQTLSSISEDSIESDIASNQTYLTEMYSNLTPTPREAYRPLSPIQASPLIAELLNESYSNTSVHSKSLLATEALSDYFSLSPESDPNIRSILPGLTDHPHCSTCKCKYL